MSDFSEKKGSSCSSTLRCIFNAGLGCVKSLHILTSSHLRIEPMEVFVAPVFKRLAEKKFHAVTLVVSCQ